MSELCRNPGARAAGGWPHFCPALGLHHTLPRIGTAAPSRRCAPPLPSWREDAAPSPRNGPPAACGLGARAPCGSCVPDSSEPLSLPTTPGHGHLASAGREGLPKQGCRGLAAEQPRGRCSAGSATARAESRPPAPPRLPTLRKAPLLQAAPTSQPLAGKREVRFRSAALPWGPGPEQQAALSRGQGVHTCHGLSPSVPAH